MNTIGSLVGMDVVVVDDDDERMANVPPGNIGSMGILGALLVRRSEWPRVQALLESLPQVPRSDALL